MTKIAERELTERELYVNIITMLYGSSVYVDEAMISDDVIEIIQTILNEIRECNVNLVAFTATANALGDVLEETWKKFGIVDPKKLLEDIFKSDRNWLNNQRIAFGDKFIDAFIKHWFAVLRDEKQARICLINAARNHKSSLAIALLGL